MRCVVWPVLPAHQRSAGDPPVEMVADLTSRVGTPGDSTHGRVSSHMCEVRTGGTQSDIKRC